MFDSHDKEWKTFYLKDIFETVSNAGAQIPTGAYVHKRYLHEGKQPRITVTALNNGIDAFYDEIKHQNKREFSNFISISFLGDAFYHRYSATLDMKVHSLKLKDRELSSYLGVFIITALDMNKSNSNYGNQLSSKDVARKQVILPVQKNGDPDYDFMELCMKKWYEKKARGYSIYCVEQLRKLSKKKPISALNEKEWKEYYLSDIFTDIKRGKRIKKENHIVGNMPYVSSRALSNGIDGFIANQEKVRIYSNCLTVANSGSVGSCYYHQYDFVASDHVTKLSNSGLNKYHYLFLSVMISHLSAKYNFNREINDIRIMKEKIMLPVNEMGDPDYDYMEQYMKNLMIMKYNRWQSYASDGSKDF